MPAPLPNLGAQRQLQKLGALAKNVGTGLFSGAQAPGPVPASFTSLGMPSTSLSLPSTVGGIGSLSGSPFGNLRMPSMVQPNFGRGGQQQTGTGPGGQPTMGSGGPVGSLGGEFAVLDQYDQFFQEAAAATGMPVNVLKAIAAVERGWEGTSVAGAQGIMQVMPFWGQDFGLNLQDPRQNILAGAKVLKSGMDQYGNMDMAIRSYLGFGQDAYGTTDQAYLQRVNQYRQQLDASGGSFGGASGGGGNITGMFGAGASVQDWGEFNVPSSNGLYGYGTSYGLNGSNHTGIDVAMPIGTPMFAPMGGTVMCAGTGVGSGTDGGGCAAFTDYMGGGAGRIEVLLDNGTVLIYGHSGTAAVRPGQRVNAGQMIGTSGGMNSPHTHLEARVRDGSTGSGWRIVDPRTVLGGGMFAGGSSTGATSGSGYGGGYSLNAAIANFLAGWGR